MDNLAHKMLHTYEKMNPINPTFEYSRMQNLAQISTNQYKMAYFAKWCDLSWNFSYLFGLFPLVTQVNTHLNEIT